MKQRLAVIAVFVVAVLAIFRGVGEESETIESSNVVSLSSAPPRRFRIGGVEAVPPSDVATETPRVSPDEPPSAARLADDRRWLHLASALRSDSRDESWSGAAEESIRNAFATDEVSGLGTLQSAECGARFCRVLAGSSDGHALARVLPAHLSGFPQGAARVASDGSGLEVVFARVSGTLPTVADFM